MMPCATFYGTFIRYGRTNMPLKVYSKRLPQRKVVVHVTDRASYRRCKRYFKYAVVNNLEPIKRAIALDFGTAMHGALAHYYSTWGNPVEYFSSLDAVPQDMTDLGISMLQRYLQTYDDKKEWRVIGVEMPIAHVVPESNVTLTGTIDLMVEDRRGQLWIVDHKTYTSFATTAELEMDDQMTAYIWLCRQSGYEVKGAIYNMLRKKVPDYPLLLKDGTLSKNKGIDTTWEVYRQAVLDNNLDLNKYTDMRAKLELNPFFKREQIIRSKKALESFGRWLPHELRDITKTDQCYYPNPTRECVRCEFNSLCSIETEQGDTVSVIEGLFQTRRARR